MNVVDIDTISDTIRIEDILTNNNDIDSILDEIDKLPNNQKTAIKLKYLEGYTLEEIALIQNTKPETIKSRLYEGKKKIKNKLKMSNFLWMEM